MLTDLPDRKLTLFSVFSQLSFDQNTRQHRRNLSKGEGCVCADAGKAGRGRVAL